MIVIKVEMNKYDKNEKERLNKVDLVFPSSELIPFDYRMDIQYVL